MSIFFKYVLKNTATFCLVAVLVFVGVLVLGNAVRDVFEWIACGRLSLFESIKILSIVIPSAASYAMPIGIFVGILITVGRLSASNELLIMKSTGMSVYRAMAPIFLVALCATMLASFINLYYAPDSITEYKRSFRKVLRENPIRFIRPGEFVDWFHGYIIHVDSVRSNDLQKLKIWQLNGADISCYISAEHGEVSYDHDSGTILLKLFEGNAEYFDRKRVEDVYNPDLLFFHELSLSLPIAGIFGEENRSDKKLRHMNLHELLYARRNWHLNQSEPLTPAVIKRDRRMVDMQISSNIAMAFGVLAMAIMAIPLGIRKNRTETSANVVLALITVFTYYLAMIALSLFANHARAYAKIAVWLPNIILVVVGFCMLRRVARN